MPTVDTNRRSNHPMSSLHSNNTMIMEEELQITVGEVHYLLIENQEVQPIYICHNI